MDMKSGQGGGWGMALKPLSEDGMLASLATSVHEMSVRVGFANCPFH